MQTPGMHEPWQMLVLAQADPEGGNAEQCASGSTHEQVSP